MTRGSVVVSKDLHRVREWFEAEISARISPLLRYSSALSRLAEQAENRADASLLTSSRVEKLNPTVEAIIHASPITIGAGFIAAPNVVDDAERYMLWLQRRNGTVRRLRLNFDTSDVDAYDYVRMDWYLHTRDRGQPSLTGPFLDYSGADALVFTLAAPVMVRSEFLGVVALDMMAQAAETSMTAQLCSLPGDVLLVNRDRTVVATNSVRWMPGERLRAMPADEPDSYRWIVPVGTWTDWQLAVAHPTSPPD